MSHEFRVRCGGHRGEMADHTIVLRDDGDGVVVSFPDHDDIEKDRLVASMRDDDLGDCFILLDALGNPDTPEGSEVLTSMAFQAIKKKDFDEKIDLLVEIGLDPRVLPRVICYAVIGPMYRPAVAMTFDDKVKARVSHFIDRGYITEDYVGNGGENLFSFAARSGKEFVNLLIEKGFDVDKKDEHGDAAIHWASLYFKLDAVEALIAAGADVDVKDLGGNTPLNIVIGEFYDSIYPGHLGPPNVQNARNAYKIAEALIEAGAETSNPKTRRYLGAPPIISLERMKTDMIEAGVKP